MALVAAPAFAQAQGAKAYSDRLAALPPIQREAALRRAVIDNGQWCKRVETAAYQQPYKNLQMWAVRCGPLPRFDYGAFIGPDGTVQVSPCADLPKVRWPACRRLP